MSLFLLLLSLALPSAGAAQGSQQTDDPCPDPAACAVIEKYFQSIHLCVRHESDPPAPGLEEVSLDQDGYQFRFRDLSGRADVESRSFSLHALVFNPDYPFGAGYGAEIAASEPGSSALLFTVPGEACERSSQCPERTFDRGYYLLLGHSDYREPHEGYLGHVRSDRGAYLCKLGPKPFCWSPCPTS